MRVYEVDATSGVTGKYLETCYYYDDSGRRYLAVEPGGKITKTLYDSLGRAYITAICSSVGSTDASSAGTLSGDVVLSQTVLSQDDADNVIQTASYVRNHDAATTTGSLVDHTDLARVTYSATWYDHANRPTHVVNYGTTTPPN